MSRVRQSGTSAELSVGRLVRGRGFDFLTKAVDLPGTPDLANPDYRWAIFVHGCFWHAHENCHKWKLPRNNRSYWKRKFVDNRRRDEKNVRLLKRMGYSVAVVWECELEDMTELGRKVDGFLKTLGSRQTALNRC